MEIKGFLITGKQPCTAANNLIISVFLLPNLFGKSNFFDI